MTTFDCKSTLQLTYVTHLPTLVQYLTTKTVNLSAISPALVAYLKKLIASRPHHVLLRAKELDSNRYEQLLLALLPAAKAAKVDIIVSHHPALGIRYNLPVQLSISELKSLVQQRMEKEKESNTLVQQREDKENYSPPLLPIPYGVSVHSLSEAQYAKVHQAQWVVFGHVFPSRCKPDLEPRNWEELKAIIQLQIPTFAIGGIHQDNFHLLPTGLTGICMMKETMEQDDIALYTDKWKKIIAKAK